MGRRSGLISENYGIIFSSREKRGAMYERKMHGIVIADLRDVES